ncbi:MAG TPA: cation:proton antiporter [Candidatus Polarisedimenticolia bacterium]|nr:cation:proton antiporter [Candidatus Polarisedimenticolia bacterium]
MRAVVTHLTLLLTQIVVVLLSARGVGFVMTRLRQPRVVGEMLAGILLGPSCLGWIAPSLGSSLFPSASLGSLNSLSQIGLVLFMFQIGAQLDCGELRRYGRAAVITSNAGIAVPFLLGVALTVLLHPRLSSGAVPYLHLALFVGTAMSVTAFPVLARILSESHLLGTRVGTLAIACAAVDDVFAWSLLAAVVLLVRGPHAALPLHWTLAGSAAFLLFMIVAARPLLARVRWIDPGRGLLTRDRLALLLVLAFSSAWITEGLGLHSVFGAFLAGCMLPRDRRLAEAVEDGLAGAVFLLLPLFFAQTGLRTSVRLLDGWSMWLLCLLIVLVAVAGKFGGATLAARLTGLSWREAAALGVLLNTRGLMELVILHVGLDVGLITPTLFAMMVIMALVTTLMTTPILARLMSGGHPPHRQGGNA